MKEYWKKINENLKDFCEQEDPILNTIPIKNNSKELFDIILRQYNNIDTNTFELFEYDINYEKIDLNDSIKIVADFYKDIDETLYNAFYNIIYDSENTKIRIDSSIESEVVKNKLNLNLHQNSYDIFVLCHESAHRIFQPVISKINKDLINKKTIIQFWFNEINSITLERVLNQKIELDKNKFLYRRLLGDLSRTIVYLFVDWISEVYLKHQKYIDFNILKVEISKIEDETIKNIFYKHIAFLMDVVYNNDVYIQFYFSKYILASVLSATLSQNLEKGNLSYQEYLEMMLKLNNIETIEEGLNILGLNYLENSDMLDKIKHNYNNSCEEILKTGRVMK